MYEHCRKLKAHVCNRVIQAWSEVLYGMHVRRSDPPCIQRCDKECLLFNTTLALSRFTPGFGDNVIITYFPIFKSCNQSVLQEIH